MFISLLGVTELHTVSVVEREGLRLGAAVTLSRMIKELEALVTADPSSSGPYSAFPALVRHLMKVAHPQVRDSASWAGNVSMARTHRDFPSDVVLVLATVGATIRTVDKDGVLKAMSVFEFVNAADPDSLANLVYDVTIPFSSEGQILDTFKVMQRHANAHALLNAGFSIEVNRAGASCRIKSAHLVVGNVRQGPLLCTKTAAALVGRPLTLDTLLMALPTLALECTPVPSPDLDPNHVVVDADFSVRVAQNLLYKFWLGALMQCKGRGAIDSRMVSAVGHAVRPVSGGSQSWPAPPAEEAPVGLPVSKVDGPIQVANRIVFDSLASVALLASPYISCVYL